MHWSEKIASLRCQVRSLALVKASSDRNAGELCGRRFDRRNGTEAARADRACRALVWEGVAPPQVARGASANRSAVLCVYVVVVLRLARSVDRHSTRNGVALATSRCRFDLEIPIM